MGLLFRKRLGFESLEHRLMLAADAAVPPVTEISGPPLAAAVSEVPAEIAPIDQFDSEARSVNDPQPIDEVISDLFAESEPGDETPLEGGELPLLPPGGLSVQTLDQPVVELDDDQPTDLFDPDRLQNSNSPLPVDSFVAPAFRLDLVSPESADQRETVGAEDGDRSNKGPLENRMLDK